MLILQNWQIILNVISWCIGFLMLIATAFFPFIDFLHQQTGLSFGALLWLIVIGVFIALITFNTIVIILKGWWAKRKSLRGLIHEQVNHAKNLDDKNMSTADSMRLKREADLDAEMKNYFDRKQAYLKEAEQYLTAKKQGQ